jgi:hypothetical protein
MSERPGASLWRKREAPRVSVATISDLTPGMSSVIFRLESDHWVVLKQKTGRTKFVSGSCGSAVTDKVSKPWKLCATIQTCLSYLNQCGRRGTHRGRTSRRSSSRYHGSLERGPQPASIHCVAPCATVLPGEGATAAGTGAATSFGAQAGQHRGQKEPRWNNGRCIFSARPPHIRHALFTSAD